ncbi:hypothetical protein LAZ67_3003803 [Cordylochernes scorpioides]|uniref:Uncharacterized protein n=1 Tax=Cordylochernes scorpioides TaxID=51811 RepID=A0ABY6KC17_9ARAC|nr:hypothetical protein LAZ67_3003803 [Cordylochernes scorpioides]
MGPLSRVSSSGQILHAPFDAFKFPTSEIVQFKALVTPCLPTCEPDNLIKFGKLSRVNSFSDILNWEVRKRYFAGKLFRLKVVCSLQCSELGHVQARCDVPGSATRELDSLGRRRRRRSPWTYLTRTGRTLEEDELVVVNAIHITDKFGFQRSERRLDSNSVQGDTINKHYRLDTMMLSGDKKEEETHPSTDTINKLYRLDTLMLSGDKKEEETHPQHRHHQQALQT